MAGLLDLLTGGLFGGQMPQQPQSQYQPQPQYPPPQQQIFPQSGADFGTAFQNFGQGGPLLGRIANAITGVTTGQRTDPVGMYQQASNQAYQALLAAKIPEPQARLAATNPEMLKQVASTYFEPPKLVKTGTDPFTGQDTFNWAQPNKMQLTPATQTAPPGSPTGAPDQSMAKFSEAVQRGVQGEGLYDYLPKTRANTIRAMIEGRLPPPGGFAMRSPAVLAQIDAANSIDPNFDANAWTQRNQMFKQLNSVAPNTLGGQLNIGNTAIGHLADAADVAQSLGNVNLGLGWLSHKVNEMRNLSTDQQAKVGQLQTYAQRYGQEITKFYAGGPGGEAERLAFLERVDASKSPPELAGVFAAERKALESRVSQYETQIRTTMGDAGLQRYPVIRPETRDKLNQIDTAVAQMSGKSQQPTTAAATSQPNLPRVASPAEAAKLPKGTRFIDSNGDMRMVP